MPLDWLKKSTWSAPGRSTGHDGRSVVQTNTHHPGLKPGEVLDGKLIVQRRHVDWLEHQIDGDGSWTASRAGIATAMRSTAQTDGDCRAEFYSATMRVPRPADVPHRLPGICRIPGERQPQTQDVGYGPYPGMIGADPAHGPRR